MHLPIIGSGVPGERCGSPHTQAPKSTTSWLVSILIALAASVVAAVPSPARAEDMHVTVLPREAWASWPEWIPYDVAMADCDAKGGTITGDFRHKLCEIRKTDCEGHPGFKVVERDTYRTASARIAACRIP